MLSTMLSKLFTGLVSVLVESFKLRHTENIKNGELIWFINVPDSKVSELLSSYDTSRFNSEETIEWLIPQLPDSSIVKQIADELKEKKVVRFNMTITDNGEEVVKYRCHHLSIDKFNNSVSMLINEDRALSYEDFMKLRNQNKSVAQFKKVTDNSPSIKV